MLQFGIRSLFLLTLTAAIFLGIAQTAGYAVAAGIIAAISVLVGAVLWRRRGQFLYLWIGSAVLAMTAIWFLAVDWSAFYGHCPDCDYCRNSAQYRIICIPFRTQVWEFPSKDQQILSDLGVPCGHADYNNEHRSRYWGLLYRTRPCLNDIFLLGDYPHEYTDAMASKLRRWGADNPERAAQLHDLVVRQRKYPTFWQTIDALTAGEPDSADPPATPP